MNPQRWERLHVIKLKGGVYIVEYVWNPKTHAMSKLAFLSYIYLHKCFNQSTVLLFSFSFFLLFIFLFYFTLFFIFFYEFNFDFAWL
jgi:hypothetical protein